MTLWWIGVVVFVVVILPVVALILNRLLRPTLEIAAYADDIAVVGATFGPHIHAAVQELVVTQKLVATARPAIEQYGRAIKELT